MSNPHIFGKSVQGDTGAVARIAAAPTNPDVEAVAVPAFASNHLVNSVTPDAEPRPTVPGAHI